MAVSVCLKLVRSCPSISKRNQILLLSAMSMVLLADIFRRWYTCHCDVTDGYCKRASGSLLSVMHFLLMP